jgi:predicted RNase H-like HicB family nuclease
MTDTKSLLQRISTAISTAPQGETYEDCRNNEAKAVLEEVISVLQNVPNPEANRAAINRIETELDR